MQCLSSSEHFPLNCFIRVGVNKQAQISGLLPFCVFPEKERVGSHYYTHGRRTLSGHELQNVITTAGLTALAIFFFAEEKKKKKSDKQSQDNKTDFIVIIILFNLIRDCKLNRLYTHLLSKVTLHFPYISTNIYELY